MFFPDLKKFKESSKYMTCLLCSENICTGVDYTAGNLKVHTSIGYMPPGKPNDQAVYFCEKCYKQYFLDDEKILKKPKEWSRCAVCLREMCGYPGEHYQINGSKSENMYSVCTKCFEAMAGQELSRALRKMWHK